MSSASRDRPNNALSASRGWCRSARCGLVAACSRWGWAASAQTTKQGHSDCLGPRGGRWLARHRQVHQRSKQTQGHAKIPDVVAVAIAVTQVTAQPHTRKAADLMAEKTRSRRTMERNRTRKPCATMRLSRARWGSMQRKHEGPGLIPHAGSAHQLLLHGQEAHVPGDAGFSGMCQSALQSRRRHRWAKSARTPLGHVAEQRSKAFGHA